MKIRYPVTALILIAIALLVIQKLFIFKLSYELYNFTINLLGLLSLICLGLIVYLILRNIIRAIKGAVTGVPQGDSYRDEAQRACERITPKKNKDVTPPWEG